MTDHSIVLREVGLNRSVTLSFSEAPPYADASRRFVVSTTSVSPSQCPRASPMCHFNVVGAMRTPVERDDARLVHHLVANRNEPGPG